MLKLIGIKKDYVTAGQTVHALKGVDLAFRRNEFVSILGASGCGKTTMLNIIGGLDHYTEGDLVINGTSTKTYKDRDWDVYRNHRIGFVFQSYNLIPHQTVLGNVEIALTIAGISKAERKTRAEEALKRVGLGEVLHKRPNQLSGGQMQRVAIARALVNNPEILLADEPTGALDTETSVQIMDLIREIAGERLVIMVTHNPELAEEYSSRIVRLQDGLVLSDSNPYEGETEQVVEQSNEKEVPMVALNANVEGENAENTAKEKGSGDGEKTVANGAPVKKKKKERTSMSFGTSLGLSARNLLMKKGRTAITSIAGSIGIISVCLVLALSNGFNEYIMKTQEDMLSSNPLKINETTVDVNAIMSGMNSADDMPDLDKIGDSVYVNSFLTSMAQGMTVTNDLSVEYIQYLENMDEDWYEAIVKDRGMKLNNSLYTQVSIKGHAAPVTMSLTSLKEYYTSLLDGQYQQLAYLVDYLGDIYGRMPGTTDVTSDSFGEYVLSQYEVIKGEFPTQENQAVLVIGDNNDLTDLTLAQLGYLNEERFVSLFKTEEEGADDPLELVSFEEIVSKKFYLYTNDTIYRKGSGEYVYAYNGIPAGSDFSSADGIEITISGILRLKDGMNYGCLGNSGLFLTEQLYETQFQKNKTTGLVDALKTQTGLAMQLYGLHNNVQAAKGTSGEQAAMQALMDFLQSPQSALLQKMAAPNLIEGYTAGATLAQAYAEDDPVRALLSECYLLLAPTALREVGGVEEYESISIYSDSFNDKEKVLEYLDEWNESHESDEKVQYTDTIGMMMSMVEMMLNAITVVLVAFTAISLVVSSVMIGIITYVSVVERVKEIGVLRSLGARKRDIRNLFNAETFIIGLSSGVFGVAVTYLISLGVNALLGKLTGIATLAALPFTSALIMVVISIVLTLISGLIPAGAAAKKDPVVALRTE